MLDDHVRQIYQGRIRIIGGLLIVILSVLFCRLWYLQVTRGDYYRELSERNRLRQEDMQAPRGIFFDRNGRSLIENEPSFTLMLRREFMRDESKLTTVLEQVFGMERAVILQRFNRYRSSPLVAPIILKNKLTFREIAYVETHKQLFPELSLIWSPIRRYPFSQTLCHILGYIGEVNDTELTKSQFQDLKPGHMVGKSGLERFYNQELMGRMGHRQYFINSMGQVTKVLQEQPPVAGGNLHTSLDLDLQLTAETLMADVKGALVALDPKTGEILCLISQPGFDPNLFMGHIPAKTWRDLIENPDRPLRNKVTQGTYAPGSIFKILIALAGLGNRRITPENSVVCNGEMTLGNHVAHCWNLSGHGTVNLLSAITNSCNIYFYHLGLDVGVDQINAWANRSGLGIESGIDLPVERRGLVPSSEWKRRVYKQEWYRGETLSVAIGQGAVTVTPLQVARFMGAVALNREPATPHFNLARRSAPGAKPLVPDDAWQIILQAMENVVNSGTGTRAQLPGIRVAGKTGTAQIISSKTAEKMENYEETFKENSWFSCFAPVEDPSIAIAIMIEHGGHGGVTSAPIAAALMKKFFEKYPPKGNQTKSFEAQP